LWKPPDRCVSIHESGPRTEDAVIKQELEALRIDRSERRPRGARLGLWTGVAVIALGITGGLLWWALGAERAVPVKVATAVERSGGSGASTVLNASGYVTARRRATVSSKITGKLTEVNIEEGDRVEAGDVLARLDDSHYRAALQLARSQLDAAQRAIHETRARLDLAEITLKRTERLVREEVSGEADLDAARAEAEALRARLSLDRERVHVAEREVALRETQLTDTVIEAPFAGVVVSKDAQEGEMISPISAGGGFTRTGICTVVDMGSLEIEVDVNEAYIARVHPDQRVEAVLDAYPGWKIPAQVITPVPTADRQKATVLVRIGFEQLDPRILPDMGIKVAFLEDEQVRSPDEVRRVLTVPRAALRADAGRDVVFVVKSDRVERRAVTVGGAPDGETVEVVAGLGPGEQVVTDGPADLADGDRVKVQ
jgi:RND family efflux transporter MFP subunit